MKAKALLLAVTMMGGTAWVSQSANADDWGCKVLLCLSDPRGPTTESECVPPIERLWEHLAEGKSFPTCAMAGNADRGEGSFARQVWNYYDLCPEGTKPAGGYVAQGTEDRSEWYRLNYTFSNHGRSNGAVGVQSTRRSQIGPRACVGNHLGTYTTWRGNSWGERHEPNERITVDVYDEVVWQQPQSPRAIDVYIDGDLHHRVHW